MQSSEIRSIRDFFFIYYWSLLAWADLAVISKSQNCRVIDRCLNQYELWILISAISRRLTMVHMQTRNLLPFENDIKYHRKQDDILSVLLITLLDVCWWTEIPMLTEVGERRCSPDLNPVNLFGHSLKHSLCTVSLLETLWKADVFWELQENFLKK